jgi:predicted membrane-bound spermidine synthase
MRIAAYGAAIFLSSAGGLVLEITAGRLIAPYVGMSLYTWTAIIAVVLGGFSLGHIAGGRLADQACDATAGARRIAIALALASASSAASLVFLKWFAGPLLAARLPMLASIVILAALLFLLPSLFVGVVSPILTKLAVDAAPEEAGRVIGRMYALGALGSIAGTLAAGYVFISWIGSTGTVLAVTALYAALALGFALPGRIAGTVAALLVILQAGFGFAGQRLEAFASPCLVESDYYCIRVDNFAPLSGRPSGVLVLDHLAHGINDRDDPRFLHSSYLQFLDAYVSRRFPPGLDRRALNVMLVGGGALSFPRALVAARADAQVLVAELDPQVTRAAVDHLWLAPDDRIELAYADARVVAQALPQRPLFDVVLSDVFHDIAMPAHLVTTEFHRELRDRLTPGGVYAVNVIDGGRDPRFLYSLVRTLEEDFPAVEVWSDAADLGTTRRITYVVLASFTPSDGDALSTTYGTRRDWRRLPREELQRRIALAGVPLLTDDFAPVDRLLAPLLLDREPGER